MIFSRGQVLLCGNGTWRKITGINNWKNEIYRKIAVKLRPLDRGYKAWIAKQF